MQTLAEQLSCGLNHFTFGFAVDLKARCAGKAEELCLGEVTHDISMHITELRPVALVNDEYYFFVAVKLVVEINAV